MNIAKKIYFKNLSCKRDCSGNPFLNCSESRYFKKIEAESPGLPIFSIGRLCPKKK
jgi:hypothetical protein